MTRLILRALSMLSVAFVFASLAVPVGRRGGGTIHLGLDKVDLAPHHYTVFGLLRQVFDQDWTDAVGITVDQHTPGSLQLLRIGVLVLFAALVLLAIALLALLREEATLVKLAWGSAAGVLPGTVLVGLGLAVLPEVGPTLLLAVPVLTAVWTMVMADSRHELG